MVRAKGTGRTLTIGERVDIQEQKKEAESTLKFLKENPTASRAESINRAGIQREVKKYDKILQEGTPVEARGTEKDRLAQRAEELRETMKKGMPTRAEMDFPGKNMGAIQKHMMWMKANDKNVREYKEVQRRLEPSDPTATDIERLRREK